MMIAMKRLDKLWDRYRAQVYQYCKEQFEEYVEPYCQQHDCEFLAGGGTFVSFILTLPGVLFNDGTYQDIVDELGEEHPLYEVLIEDIPGMPMNCVGSLMPNYRKEACDND